MSTHICAQAVIDAAPARKEAVMKKYL